MQNEPQISQTQLERVEDEGKLPLLLEQDRHFSEEAANAR